MGRQRKITVIFDMVADESLGLLVRASGLRQSTLLRQLVRWASGLPSSLNQDSLTMLQKTCADLRAKGT